MAAELLLVFGEPFKPLQKLSAARLNHRPPDIDQPFRRRRRRQARQTFANEQRQRVFERRIGAIAHQSEAVMAVLVFKARGQIAGHAGHARRPEPLDAGAFGGLEHGARRSRRRSDAAMYLGVVATDAQRQAIRPSARQRDIFGSRGARRFRNENGFTSDFTLAGPEVDLDVGVAGDGAHRRPEDALQRLGRRFAAFVGRDGHFGAASA